MKSPSKPSTRLALGMSFVLTVAPALADSTPPVLWYDEPAAKWEEALPVCNGRLGAMVFGDHAYLILKHLISPGLTYPNMFDAHPPFQIDGNFGGAASIAEMLMQSRLGTVSTAEQPTMTPEIELLPALPTAWPSGSVKGLRARGGFEVDITWEDGELREAVVRSNRGGNATLRLGDTTVAVTLSKDDTFRWDEK